MGDVLPTLSMCMWNPLSFHVVPKAYQVLVILQVLISTPLCARPLYGREWYERCLTGYQHGVPFACTSVSANRFDNIALSRYLNSKTIHRGDPLRIISTSLTLGSRTMSARSEVQIDIASVLHAPSLT